MRLLILLIPALLSAQHGFYAHATTGNVLGQGFSYYVDPASGSDNVLTTSGTSPAAPFASFTPLTTQNLLKQSVDLTQSPWAVTSGGTRTATSISFAASANSEVYQNVSISYSAFPLILTITCDAAAASGTGKVRLHGYTGTTDVASSDFNLTTTYQTITYSFTMSTGSGTFPGLQNGSDGVARTVLFRNVRVNATSTPSLYMPTTTTSVGDCTHTPCVWDSVLNGNSVALKAGGTWNQELDITHPNVKVGRYGFGANPTIDGASTLTNASFAPVSGNVYSQVITLPSNDSPSDPGWYTSVWETIPGHARTRLQNCGSTTSIAPYCHGGNVAAVQAQSGSYLAVIISTGPTYTLNVQASDGSDPRSNGYLYEFSARQYAINASGQSGITLNGIYTARTINANGSINVGQNSTLINVQAQEGTKHNLFYNAGAVLNNVTATTFDYGTVGATPFVGFDTPQAVLGFTYIGTLGGAFEHTNTGGTTVAFTKAYNCSSGPGQSFAVGGSSVQVIINGSVSHAGLAFAQATNISLSGDLIDSFTSSAQYGVNAPLATTAVITGSTINGPGTGAGTSAALIGGATPTITLTNNTITNVYQGLDGSTGGSITATGNTVNIGQYWIYVSGTPTIVSDNNTFAGYNVSSFADLNGTVYSYAAWKGLGYDTHSTP